MGNSAITGPLPPGDTESTAAMLQATLVELIDLSLIGKQAHWNVVGPHFRSVHEHLDELVATARTYADKVAERTTALGVSPTGTAGAVAARSPLGDYPTGWRVDDDTVAAITGLLAGMIERVRERIEQTGKTDPVTQDLLIELGQRIEEAHWMWQAQKAGR